MSAFVLVGIGTSVIVIISAFAMPATSPISKLVAAAASGSDHKQSQDSGPFKIDLHPKPQSSKVRSSPNPFVSPLESLRKRTFIYGDLIRGLNKIMTCSLLWPTSFLYNQSILYT